MPPKCGMMPDTAQYQEQRMIRGIKLAFIFWVFLADTNVGVAQVAGILSGRVDDATGGAVAGATITVRSRETGSTRVVNTDETGNFRVFFLPVGSYEVRAEKPGFQSVVRTSVNLAVGQEAVVNLKLDVGQVSQAVIVSADAPLVDTTTAEVS